MKLAGKTSATVVSIIVVSVVGGVLIQRSAVQAAPEDPVPASFAADSHDISEVQAVATDTIMAAQQLGLPADQWSASSIQKMQPRIASNDLATPGPMPAAADLEVRQSDYQRRLNGVFAHAPDALQRSMLGLTNTIQAERDANFRFYGCGVSQLDIQTVTVAGDRATVNATTEIWSHFAMRDASGRFHEFEPVSTTMWTIQLASDTSRQWFVTDSKWVFDPKTAP
jgi:hypothetical protein